MEQNDPLYMSCIAVPDGFENQFIPKNGDQVIKHRNDVYERCHANACTVLQKYHPRLSQGHILITL